MNAHVVFAILKRNFSSYFASPTGYVFICVFVALSSIAAFWPNDFFNSNLANLDQLNKYLPLIMLVFIPAISMSIWAEERRQGTDELLLTIPAADFDVVVGKYLAAVSIFSVALLFSLVCNLLVLSILGAPDFGLFLGTYAGYWLVGLAMLSIGMMASFLTGNLTVGFVLGALFNVPLVFANYAEVILPQDLALLIKQWSLAAQFRDFGRGVISLASIGYFLMIIAVMLYLCMVLIGRRHWAGGRQGSNLGLHYGVRALALVGLAVGVVLLLERTALRVDVTSERLSSLSRDTRKLLADLDPKKPVLVEAYVSPDVPETYVQTRLNLLSALREFEALGGDKIRVRVYDTEPLSEEADRAEQKYGITGRPVQSRSRGAIKFDDIYLGVAFTSGLNKVVVPFVDRGVPVEYELIRSISTVNKQERKKLGVLNTDARLFGGFDQATFSPTRSELIIDELQKQYDVVQVSADSPITEKYDVLLAVQPSTLGPEQMDNFIACVRSGQAVAIFEDPFPYLAPGVTATSAPKQPQQNPFMMQSPPQPKGEIRRLWDLLGVYFYGDQVIWQDSNLDPKIAGFLDREGLRRYFVFIDEGVSDQPPFNQEEIISSNLQQLLFTFCGAVSPLNASHMRFYPLVSTGTSTGTVDYDQILEQSFFGRGSLNPRARFIPTSNVYPIAARVHGKAPEADSASAEDGQDKKPPAEINAVIVADIDVLYSAFFLMRAEGQNPDREFNLNLDNVTFVLNVLDVLADDPRFVEIRKRRPVHRTLETIEAVTNIARDEAIKNREKFVQEFETAKSKEEKKFAEEIEKLQQSQGVDPRELITRVQLAQEVGQRRLQAKLDQLQKKRDKETQKIERELALRIRRVQDGYKLWAVVLPPIPPLLVGLGVFFNRRAREREGVARSRLK